jgi:asparagine synthase (glutamine-hydrolysing)
MRRYFDREGDATLLGRLLYADMKTYLHELLMKQDQMSMAASLESRVPFLDHHLVEYTAAMPEHLKLHGSTTKYVLREAMKGVLPDAILTRSKMGFPVPVGRWFRTSHRPVIDEYVLSARALGRGLLDEAFVRALVAEHQARRQNHDERLWALVNLEIWMRTCVDRDVVPPALPDVPESPRH